MENLIGKFTEYGALYGLKILGAIAIFIVGKWLAKLITTGARKLMAKSKVDETLISFVGNLVYFVLLLMVIIAAINNLGVNTTSLVAVLGAAGLAIGLALQGSLSNFGASMLLITFKPFKVGDLVEVAGQLGVVEDISILSTTLKTPDNKAVIVPNSGIIGSNITNYSAKDTRRVDLTFGVSYSDDLKAVKAELEDIMAGDSRILQDPAPFVAVSALADSSVNFVVRPWVRTEDYWGVYFDLTEKVKIRFDEKGIAIPFPQRDVHLFQTSQ